MFAVMLNSRALGNGVVALLALLGIGCAGTASVPDSNPPHGEAQAVVSAATRVLGSPYRYGGYSPRGFDCSGLVYYAHRQAGIGVPRTTEAQRRHARPVSLAALRAGDLVFFELEGEKVSHVGIFVGPDRFIHAPSSGKVVSYASLQSPFWSSRLVGAGRFH